MLQNEIQVMTKLRHPRVLSILRPAQDSKKALIIETEPVFASLANILRDYTNLKPSHALESFELEPLEIKIAALQITEALDFIHHNAKKGFKHPQIWIIWHLNRFLPIVMTIQVIYSL